MTNNQNGQKFCFSYIRYSSANQVGNTSVDRQMEVAPRVAAKMGWTLRTDLAVLQEKTSAYKGLNIPMIKGIIHDVETGLIPSGTVMIIEKFNRAFRQKLEDSVPLLWEMLKSGLELYIDQTDRYLTRKSLADENMEMTIAIQELKTAFKHSNDLSDQVKKAFKIKRERILEGNAKGFSRKHMPGWLTAEGFTAPRGNFVITGYHPNEKAQIVEQAFNSYFGGVGACEVARKFNVANEPTLTEGLRKGKKRLWNQSVIYRLLSDRAAIGERVVNGEIIPNFYPAIVSNELFLKVQAKLNDNRGKHTYQGENTLRNIFSGVAVCSHCGQQIRVSKSGTGYSYIGCHGAFKGLCNVKKSIRYNLLEDAFASLLRNNPEHLIPDEQGNETSAAIRVWEGQEIEIRKEIANITEALGFAVTKALVLRQAELEKELEEVARKKESEIAKGISFQGGKEILSNMVARLDNLATDKELRTQVQGWIRRYVETITVDRVTTQVMVFFKSGYEMGIDLNTQEVIVNNKKVEYFRTKVKRNENGDYTINFANSVSAGFFKMGQLKVG